jgi:hypothetical protein
MIFGNELGNSFSSAILASDDEISSTRRALLIAPLLATLPLVMSGAAARAEQINRAEMAITLSDAIKWSPWSGGPPHSEEVAALYGGVSSSWRSGCSPLASTQSKRRGPYD